jgi:cytochrome d ubiquinol oxidase subunit II
MDLNTLWFVLLAILLTGYAVLDGFDLGVGVLHLFTRGDSERRTAIMAIGPVWDGNEVWLLTGGGAIFAAFPHVYATVFSGFYLALMLLLLALILRAISLELRDKEPMAWWRQLWDTCFAAGSFLAVTLLGIALGNIAYGIPVGPGFEYAGSFFTLLRPWPVLVGLSATALATAHGALWLALKTEGELQQRARGWAWRALAVFAVLFGVASIWAVAAGVPVTRNLFAQPLLWAVLALPGAGLVRLVQSLARGRDLGAFLGSSTVIVGLMALFAVGMFPHLVVAAPDAQHGLDIHNAASSTYTLGVMAIIAAIGVPVVLGYTAWAYWTFRGKVRLEGGY